MVNNDQHPGSTIVRGPMANDHYTTVHNLVARSQVIPTQYVGVFLYITSHVEGWKLTEAKIAKDVGKGKAFVKSAIAAIENAHCLIREQMKSGGGEFGESRWFVTDLPLQLRQLGVFDESTIRAKVYEAFAEWKKLVDNSPHSVRHGATRHNDDGEQNPSAAPMSGNQTSVNPQRSTDVRLTDIGSTDIGSTDIGSPAPKKTKDQEDQRFKKTNSSVVSSQRDGATDVDPAGESEEQNINSHQPTNTQQHGGDADASTATDSPDRESTDPDLKALIARFWDAVPADVAPNSRQRPKLDDVLSEVFAADQWGADSEGPELLASWLHRRVPRQGVHSAPAWIRNQLTHYLPGGPGEADRQHVVPHSQCPEGCDENSLIIDAWDRAHRCPYNHAVTYDARNGGSDRHTEAGTGDHGGASEEGDPVSIERIMASLDAAPGVVPAGAVGADVDADGAAKPPF